MMNSNSNIVLSVLDLASGSRRRKYSAESFRNTLTLAQRTEQMGL